MDYVSNLHRHVCNKIDDFASRLREQNASVLREAQEDSRLREKETSKTEKKSKSKRSVLTRVFDGLIDGGDVTSRSQSKNTPMDKLDKVQQTKPLLQGKRR